ncbi:MAG: AAA family ATPase [Gammaproteobacteria bacterium]
MSYAGRGTAGRTARGSYLDVLDLQRPPFGLDPDPAFFYAEPTLMQRLDLLVHLAQFSDRILIVTGPAGAGKTSLLQQFMSRAGESWRPCAMDSTEAPHSNALLARLASCFGGAGKADSTAVDVPALLERWHALQSAGHHPMVVIDDAHKLNTGTLEALLNLAGDPAQTAARVRVILLGEPSLLALLARAGLDPERDHLVHTMSLPALNAEQTAAYMAYRLAVAGYSGESPFAPTEARAIHKASGGVPGRINQLAHEHLEEHMTGADSSKSAAKGRRVPRWAIIALGVIVLGVVLWNQDAINRLFNPGTGGARKTVPLKLPAQPAPPKQARRNSHSPLLAPMPPDVGPGSSAPIERNGSTGPKAAGSGPAAQGPQSTSGSAESAGNHTAAAPPQSASKPATKPAPSESQGASPPSATPSPAGTPSAAATPPSTAGPATPGSTTPAPAAKSAPATKPAPAAKPTPATTPAPSSPPASKTTESAEPTRPSAAAAPAAPAKAPKAAATPAPKTSTPAPAAAKPQAPATGGPGRAAWLLQQNPKAYTLQLLGARDEASVRRFIRVHHLGKRAMYYTGEFKGAPWYVLLYGVYPDIQTAHKALAGLPASVRKGGPWARRLASVQKDIRERRKAAQ